MVMEKCYAEENLVEVWQKINQLHLSYLEMGENPQKLEHRNKLEEYINRYLHNVPHSRKFEFPQSAKVLYMSASEKRDFSGYRAAVGWDAIGRYAANIITKPWRREYRQIKMYSGFYKHEIETNLVGAEMMFEIMGYRKIDNEIMYLDGPICPDKVASVSLDSLFAYVECQILKVIWEEVSKVFNISWLDVLKFRERHLGSPKQSVSALIYLHQQQQYQEKLQLSYAMVDPKLLHHNLPYPAYPSPQMHMSHYPPPCMYNGCCNNGHQCPCPPPPQYMPAVTYPPKTYMQPAYNKYNAVPTAQLIELDPHTYDCPDGGTASNFKRYSSSTSAAKPPSYDEVEGKMRQLQVSDREEGSGTFESWDYVYRNLESQGYSKDLGERGDLLEQPPEKRKTKVKPPEQVYDNIQGPSKKVVDPNKWHCATCTFLNATKQDICEMCGKSREKLVDDLKVGGAECDRCTFVNSKTEKKCTVCGNNLDNSPTYI